MSRTLPALILRLLASRITLAGLRFFTACAERLAPAAQPDPAALDEVDLAESRGERWHLVRHETERETACGRYMPRLRSLSPRHITCPDCLRAYHGEERPS